MNKAVKGQKFSAVFVLVCFLSGELLRPAGVMAAPFTIPEVAIAASFKIDLPADLGKVETLISNASPNAIIQIQEAHGDLESQKKIKGILHYLKDQYGVDLLLLEGNASKLHPEYLNYFPGRADLNRKVLEELAPKGMASGPVFFLQAEPAVEAWGIEKTDSYRRNGAAFIEVLQRREKTEKFVGELNLQIERLTAPYLSKKLRRYLKRVEAFENGLVPFDGWLREQKDFAAAILKQDLASPALQMEWPMFVRLFVLKEFEAKLNMTEFARERGEFLKAVVDLPRDLRNEIECYLETPLSQSQLPDPETGILFENMVAGLPANFSYQTYPNVTFYIGHLILQSELKGDKLFDELGLLTDRIADRLAETPHEKEIVGLLKKHRLLKRLFNLELSPKDYEGIKQLEVRSSKFEEENQREKVLGNNLPTSNFSARGRIRHLRGGQLLTSLRPSAFIQQFKKLNSEKLVRNYEFKHLAEVDALYDRALDFYQGAEERDGDMLKNIETRLKASGKSKAVVVTGGFHAEPFRNYFNGKGYNYALITPTMTESVMKARESYVQSVLQNYIAPLDPRKSEHRVTDFSISANESLKRLGVMNPLLFKRALRDAIQVVTPPTMAMSEVRNTSRLGTSPTAGLGVELATEKKRSEMRAPIESSDPITAEDISEMKKIESELRLFFERKIGAGSEAMRQINAGITNTFIGLRPVAEFMQQGDRVFDAHLLAERFARIDTNFGITQELLEELRQAAPNAATISEEMDNKLRTYGDEGSGYSTVPFMISLVIKQDSAVFALFRGEGANDVKQALSDALGQLSAVVERIQRKAERRSEMRDASRLGTSTPVDLGVTPTIMAMSEVRNERLGWRGWAVRLTLLAAVSFGGLVSEVGAQVSAKKPAVKAAANKSEEVITQKAKKIFEVAKDPKYDITQGSEAAKGFTLEDARSKELQEMTSAPLENHLRFRYLVMMLAKQAYDDNFRPGQTDDGKPATKLLTQSEVSELAEYLRTVDPKDILTASAKRVTLPGRGDVHKLALFQDPKMPMYHFALAVVMMHQGTGDWKYYSDLFAKADTDFMDYVPEAEKETVAKLKVDAAAAKEGDDRQKAEEVLNKKLREICEKLVYNLATVLLRLHVTGIEVPDFTTGDANYIGNDEFSSRPKEERSIGKLIEYLGAKKAAQTAAEAAANELLRGIFQNFPVPLKQALLKEQADKGIRTLAAREQVVVAELRKLMFKKPKTDLEKQAVHGVVSSLQREMTDLMKDYEKVQGLPGDEQARAMPEFMKRYSAKQGEWRAAFVRMLVENNAKILAPILMDERNHALPINARLKAVIDLIAKYTFHLEMLLSTEPLLNLLELDPKAGNELGAGHKSMDLFKMLLTQHRDFFIGFRNNNLIPQKVKNRVEAIFKEFEREFQALSKQLPRRSEMRTFMDNVDSAAVPRRTALLLGLSALFGSSSLQNSALGQSAAKAKNAKVPPKPQAAGLHPYSVKQADAVAVKAAELVKRAEVLTPAQLWILAKNSRLNITAEGSWITEKNGQGTTQNRPVADPLDQKDWTVKIARALDLEKEALSLRAKAAKADKETRSDPQNEVKKTAAATSDEQAEAKEKEAQSALSGLVASTRVQERTVAGLVSDLELQRYVRMRAYDIVREDVNRSREFKTLDLRAIHEITVSLWKMMGKPDLNRVNISLLFPSAYIATAADRDATKHSVFDMVLNALIRQKLYGPSEWASKALKALKNAGVKPELTDLGSTAANGVWMETDTPERRLQFYRYLTGVFASGYEQRFEVGLLIPLMKDSDIGHYETNGIRDLDAARKERDRAPVTLQDYALLMAARALLYDGASQLWGEVGGKLGDREKEIKAEFAKEKKGPAGLLPVLPGDVGFFLEGTGKYDPNTRTFFDPGFFELNTQYAERLENLRVILYESDVTEAEKTRAIRNFNQFLADVYMPRTLALVGMFKDKALRVNGVKRSEMRTAALETAATPTLLMARRDKVRILQWLKGEASLAEGHESLAIARPHWGGRGTEGMPSSVLINVSPSNREINPKATGRNLAVTRLIQSQLNEQQRTDSSAELPHLFLHYEEHLGQKRIAVYRIPTGESQTSLEQMPQLFSRLRSNGAENLLGFIYVAMALGQKFNNKIFNPLLPAEAFLLDSANASKIPSADAAPAERTEEFLFDSNPKTLLSILENAGIERQAFFAEYLRKALQGKNWDRLILRRQNHQDPLTGQNAFIVKGSFGQKGKAAGKIQESSLQFVILLQTSSPQWEPPEKGRGYVYRPDVSAWLAGLLDPREVGSEFKSIRITALSFLSFLYMANAAGSVTDERQKAMLSMRKSEQGNSSEMKRRDFFKRQNGRVAYTLSRASLQRWVSSNYLPGLSRDLPWRGSSLSVLIHDNKLVAEDFLKNARELNQLYLQRARLTRGLSGLAPEEREGAEQELQAVTERILKMRRAIYPMESWPLNLYSNEEGRWVEVMLPPSKHRFANRFGPIVRVRFSDPKGIIFSPQTILDNIQMQLVQQQRSQLDEETQKFFGGEKYTGVRPWAWLRLEAGSSSPSQTLLRVEHGERGKRKSSLFSVIGAGSLPVERKGGKGFVVEAPVPGVQYVKPFLRNFDPAAGRIIYYYHEGDSAAPSHHVVVNQFDPALASEEELVTDLLADVAKLPLDSARGFYTHALRDLLSSRTLSPPDLLTARFIENRPPEHPAIILKNAGANLLIQKNGAEYGTIQIIRHDGGTLYENYTADKDMMLEDLLAAVLQVENKTRAEVSSILLYAEDKPQRRRFDPGDSTLQNTNVPVGALVTISFQSARSETRKPRKQEPKAPAGLPRRLFFKQGLALAGSGLGLAGWLLWPEAQPPLLRQRKRNFTGVLPLYIVYGHHDGEGRFERSMPYFREAIAAASKNANGEPQVVYLHESVNLNASTDMIFDRISVADLARKDAEGKEIVTREAMDQFLERLKKLLADYRRNESMRNKMEKTRQRLRIQQKWVAPDSLVSARAKPTSSGGASAQRFLDEENLSLKELGVPYAAFEYGTFETDLLGIIAENESKQMQRALLAGDTLTALDSARKSTATDLEAARLRDISLNQQILELLEKHPSLSILHFRGQAHKQFYSLLAGEGARAQSVELVEEFPGEYERFQKYIQPVLGSVKDITIQKKAFLMLLVMNAREVSLKISQNIEKDLDALNPGQAARRIDKIIKAIAQYAQGDDARIYEAILKVFRDEKYLTEALYQDYLAKEVQSRSEVRNHRDKIIGEFAGKLLAVAGPLEKRTLLDPQQRSLVMARVVDALVTANPRDSGLTSEQQETMRAFARYLKDPAVTFSAIALDKKITDKAFSDNVRRLWGQQASYFYQHFYLKGALNAGDLENESFWRLGYLDQRIGEKIAAVLTELDVESVWQLVGKTEHELTRAGLDSQARKVLKENLEKHDLHLTLASESEPNRSQISFDVGELDQVSIEDLGLRGKKMQRLTTHFDLQKVADLMERVTEGVFITPGREAEKVRGLHARTLNEINHALKPFGLRIRKNSQPVGETISYAQLRTVQLQQLKTFKNPKISKAFAALNISTVAELLQKSEQDFLRLEDFEATDFLDLQNGLEPYGFFLRSEVRVAGGATSKVLAPTAPRSSTLTSVRRSAAAMVILAVVFMGRILPLGASPELMTRVVPSAAAAETPTIRLPAQIQQAVDALIVKQGMVDTSRPVIDHRFLEGNMDEAVLEDVVATLAILIRMPGLRYYMPVTGDSAAFNDFKVRLEAAVRAKFHTELSQIQNFRLTPVPFANRLRSSINQYLNLLGGVDTAGILSGDSPLVADGSGFALTGKPLRIKIDDEEVRPAAIVVVAEDLSRKSLLALDRFARAESYLGTRLAGLMADLAALKAVIRAA